MIERVVAKRRGLAKRARAGDDRHAALVRWLGGSVKDPPQVVCPKSPVRVAYWGQWPSKRPSARSIAGRTRCCGWTTRRRGWRRPLRPGPTLGAILLRLAIYPAALLIMLARRRQRGDAEEQVSRA